MDIITLTNSSINFLLFCLMSSQFRENLKQLFLSQPQSEPFAVPEIEVFFMFAAFSIVGKALQNLALISLNKTQDNSLKK